MKILHRKTLILGTVLLLTVGICRAARIKRQSDDDGDDGDGVVNDLDVTELQVQIIRIPFFGPFLVNTMNLVSRSFISTSGMLNTVIAWTIGGSMPCTMGVGDGFKCTNGSMENDILNILEKMAVGDSELPLPVKYIIYKVIKDTLEPLVERFFNGRPRINSNIDS